MKKIFITGGTGFCGSHLLDAYLERDDVKLFAIKRWRSRTENVEHIKDGVEWIECDITDAGAVNKVIKNIKPDIIHHLAAQSFVTTSWLYPAKTFNVNIMGSLYLFEAVMNHCPEAIVQVASSSEIYGVPKFIPITEAAIPEPCSPYAVSKLAMDRLAAQFHKSYGMKSVITRAFNHEGARRGDVFVISSFAKQLMEIKHGIRNHTIEVGNLDSKRDWTNVRDMVKAYIVAVEKCSYGEPYNICSNNSVSVKEMLGELTKLSGLKVKIKISKERIRPSDLYVLEGDNSKFCKKTGWKPESSLTEILKETLEYWDEKIKKEIDSEKK